MFVYILVPLSAVCLHFGTVASCLFKFWYHCQLFVYIYSTIVNILLMLIFGAKIQRFLYTNIARFARNVENETFSGDFQTLCENWIL